MLKKNPRDSKQLERKHYRREEKGFRGVKAGLGQVGEVTEEGSPGQWSLRRGGGRRGEGICEEYKPHPPFRRNIWSDVCGTRRTRTTKKLQKGVQKKEGQFLMQT